MKTDIMKLAMAATLAAGMAAGAADARKGFALRTFYDTSHSSAGVGESTRTISAEAIAAGDVTVPCAIHYLENTAGDAKGLVVGVTVTSEDGDASTKHIKFVLHEPGESSYFANEWSGTWNGTDFSMTAYMGFAGTVKHSKKLGYYFSPDGVGYFYATEGQTFAGTANAFTSCAWIAPVGDTYHWTGATSDENPLFVFDVILPKGTPAGTYTVKFCEWDTDPTDGNEIPAPMVEAMDGTMYTRKAGNLTLSSLTITVKGATPVSTRAGDANCDGNVDLSDAILIMQALTNPDKYGVDGSDPTHITAQGMINADVDGSKGVAPKDALTIQQHLAGIISVLKHTARNSVAHSRVTGSGPLRDGSVTLIGDANVDRKVTVADAVAILQDLAYPDKYQLKPRGRINADVDKKVVGVSPGDAYVIKQVDARLVSQDSLPLNAN